MSATVSLLREGDYIRRFDTGFDGAVDTYYVKDLLLDSQEDRNQVATIIEATLGPNPSKWGLPLTAIRTKRLSADKAKAWVTWGRSRNGGYFLPITYSRVETVGRVHQVPSFFQDASGQWKIKWYTVERVTSRFAWNTRVPNTDINYANARIQVQAFKGMLYDLGTLGKARLSEGSGFRRLASNEIRAELVFEQPSAVVGFAAGTIGNSVDVPPLAYGEEYLIWDADGGFPPEIEVVPYTSLYDAIPDGAFAWMDFSL